MAHPKEKSTIAGYINTSVYDAIREIAEDKMDMKVSQFVNDALYSYLSRHQDIDITEEYPELDKIIRNKDRYRKEGINHEFHSREHTVAVNSLKGVTFFDYVDKNLAEIYKRNTRHMSEEILEEMMTAHLQVYKQRVDHYNQRFDSIDFEERLKWRMQDPIQYATDKLKDLRKEKMIDNEN